MRRVLAIAMALAAAWVFPAVATAAQSGNLTVGGVVTQLISGGAGGAILTIIIGLIKNRGA